MIKQRKRAGLIDFVFIIIALGCLVLMMIPLSSLKETADALASDGNFERLTPELGRVIRLLSAAAACFFTALTLWHIFCPESWRLFWRSFARIPGRCFRDIRPFFNDLGKAFSFHDSGFWMMIIFFAAGTVLRLLQLGRPLLHDEAYTMAIWGRSNLLFAVSDYHLPNNHVFNSVLINLVYHHLGKTPELLRLPVLISGCFLIPSVWLLGRLFYNDFTAMIAAGLTAFAPFLVFYSVNARGYEIQTLLSVLTLGLAVYGKRKGNIFAWVLLILLSGVNFFTLPVALYPFGGICVWLFLNVIFYKPEKSAFRSRRHLFKYLIFMGIAVSALSMLLYVPLLRYSGWDSFFGNIYIGGTEASTFGQTMISRLIDNVQAFTEGLPIPVIIVIALGLLLSFFVFRKTSGENISYGAAIFLWMGLLIPFQKPNLWPRTLLFLHPFLLLFAASGLAGLRESPRMNKIVLWGSAAVILGAGIPQFYEAFDGYPVTGSDEQAVQMILEREGDNAANIHFVTAAQDNAPLWIYADAYDLPNTIFDKRVTFNTVYAYVNPLNDSYLGPKDIDDLLDRFGPGSNFIDLDHPEILMEEPDGILYRFPGRESAILKAYGEYPPLPDNN